MPPSRNLYLLVRQLLENAVGKNRKLLELGLRRSPRNGPLLLTVELTEVHGVPQATQAVADPEYRTNLTQFNKCLLITFCAVVAEDSEIY